MIPVTNSIQWAIQNMSEKGYYIVKDQKAWFLGHEWHEVTEKPQQFLTGDQVERDPLSGKMRLIRRVEKIPGVLRLTSKKVYSVGKKILKEFKPADPRYPTILVSTKTHHAGHDRYVLVNPENYYSELLHYRGVVENSIGQIGDPEAEEIYLRHRHQVWWKKYPRALLKQLDVPTPDPYEKIRVDLTEQKTPMISIDPKGSRDLDDLVSFEKRKDKLVLQVHIADPESLIPVDSTLDRILLQRGTSVYFPKKTFHLLPEEWATDRCSLLEGEIRYGVTVEMVFDSDGIRKEYTIKKTLLKNRHQYSYDEFQKSYQNDGFEPMYEFGRLLHQLAPKLESQQREDYDAHQMVAIFMIQANLAVGDFLRLYEPERALFRLQDGFQTDPVKPREGKSEDAGLSEDDCKLINRYRLEAAEYCVSSGEKKDKEEKKHHGLGVSHYVHFTSPIRRYSDLITHRLIGHWLLGLKQDISPMSLPQTAYWLNKATKNARLASREMERLHFIQENPSLKCETEAIVLGWKQNRLSLFLPKYQLQIFGNIYAKQLEESITITSTETELTLTSTEKEESKSIKFSLGDRFMITLLTDPSASVFHDKFRIQFPDEFRVSIHL